MTQKKKNRKNKAKTKEGIFSRLSNTFKVVGFYGDENYTKYYKKEDIKIPLIEDYIETKKNNIFTKKHLGHVKYAIDMVQDLGDIDEDQLRVLAKRSRTTIGGFDKDMSATAIKAGRNQSAIIFRREAMGRRETAVFKEFIKRTKSDTGPDFIKTGGKLGQGTYGSVYKIKDKKTGNTFAVKVLNIDDEVDFIDEIGTSMFFSEEHIGPQVQSIYRFDIPSILDGNYGFIVMELLDHTLADHLSQKYLTNEQETEFYNIIKKSVENGYVCTDLKSNNIMVKNGHIKFIDFGVWCCDVYKGYDTQAIIDYQTIILSYNKGICYGLFHNNIKQLRRDKKRFAKLIKLFTENTEMCNITDKYPLIQRTAVRPTHPNDGIHGPPVSNTLSSSIRIMFDSYVTGLLMYQYNLDDIPDDSGKPDYILSSFGRNDVKISGKASWRYNIEPFYKDDDFFPPEKEQEVLKAYSVRIMVAIEFILNCRKKIETLIQKTSDNKDSSKINPLTGMSGANTAPWVCDGRHIKSYDKILPPKLYNYLYRDNQYMKDKSVRFYKKTGTKSYKNITTKRQHKYKKKNTHKKPNKWSKHRGR